MGQNFRSVFWRIFTIPLILAVAVAMYFVLRNFMIEEAVLQTREVTASNRTINLLSYQMFEITEAKSSSSGLELTVQVETAIDRNNFPSDSRIYITLPWNRVAVDKALGPGQLEFAVLTADDPFRPDLFVLVGNDFAFKERTLPINISQVEIRSTHQYRKEVRTASLAHKLLKGVFIVAMTIIAIVAASILLFAPQIPSKPKKEPYIDYDAIGIA